MASPLNLTPEQYKAVEHTRGRVWQLTNNIASLKNDVMRGNPLPSAASLQNSAFILQQNLSTLLETTASHADLFQRIQIHPSTNFPGRTQEPIITTLLRKKLDPDVEDAADAARQRALAAGIGPDSFAGSAAKPAREVDSDDDEEGYEEESEEEEEAREPAGLGDVWGESREGCLERVTEFIRDEAADEYTRAEREAGVENVRTGLRRSLGEESDEDEDEDEEMVDAGTAPAPAQAAGVVGVEPEVALWAAVRGDVFAPGYLELESKKKGLPNR